MANILPCSFDTVLVNFKYCYQYNSPVFDYHPKYNHNWPNYILKKKVLKYGWGSMYHGNKANISQIIKILTYHISLHDANYEAQWSKKGNSDWLQSLQIPSLLESESEVTQSYLTLCSPMDCSLPGSSIHGIFQARILEWVAISFSRGSSPLRDWTCLLQLLHWQADSLPLSHLGDPLICCWWNAELYNSCEGGYDNI